MTVMTVSVDALFKDLYPRPGTHIKQWVVEMRREQAWERETCPRVEVPAHEDNTGSPCRNHWLGEVPWTHLDHDCCHVCNDLQDATESRPDVVAWRALKAERPPITGDRDALSDEIEPKRELRDHPAFVAFRNRGGR